MKILTYWKIETPKMSVGQLEFVLINIFLMWLGVIYTLKIGHKKILLKVGSFYLFHSFQESVKAIAMHQLHRYIPF